MKTPLKIALSLFVSQMALAASAAPLKATCTNRYNDKISLSVDGARLVIQGVDADAQKVVQTAISAPDAEEYGFTLDVGAVAYMAYGDDDYPNQYVVLPAHANLVTGNVFTAWEGANAPDEGYDDSMLIPMTCTVL